MCVRCSPVAAAAATYRYVGAASRRATNVPYRRALSYGTHAREPTAESAAPPQREREGWGKDGEREREREIEGKRSQGKGAREVKRWLFSEPTSILFFRSHSGE